MTYSTIESPPTRYDDAAQSAAATTRPRDDLSLKKAYQYREKIARSLRSMLCCVVVGASIFLAYDDGVGSFLGNASQTLVTGAFAIQDPLRLNVVAGVGSLFQILFFVIRDERIWSAIYWSVAQLGLNFWAIYRLYTKPLDTEHVFGDKQLFVARVLLQRAGGLHLSPPDLHQLLLGGSLLPPPVWDYLEPGEPIPVDRAALLCNGSVLVTRPEDGSSRTARRGALLHSDVVAKKLDALPPSPRPSLAKSPPLAKSRSFSSFAEEPPTTCAAAEPCEVLSWDVDALVDFLRKKRDVRLCVNALIATAKLESYMHLDPTNERTKW